jgi:hypothetical protein
VGFLLYSLFLSHIRFITVQPRPYFASRRPPSDLFHRVNGRSYEWCRVVVPIYLGPPKGEPSAVLTHACNT